MAQAFRRLDEAWRGHLSEVIERGVREGDFRADLDPTIAATTIMAQIKGSGYQMLGEADLAQADAVVAELAAQAEQWLTGRPPAGGSVEQGSEEEASGG